MRPPLIASLVLLALACGCAASRGRAEAGSPGALWVCGGGTLAPELLAEFVQRAGGPQTRLVLIPGASRTADEPTAIERQLARWRERGVADVVVLHSRDRAQADQEDFAAPLRSATAVWFGGGDQKRLAEVYAGTRVEAEIQALLARGGVVGGTSAGAAIQSRVMIGGGNPEPLIGVGLDLVPCGIVDQHFRARKREPRLVAAVRAHPECVGYGVDEGTALVIEGKTARVLGAGGVTVVRAAAGGEPVSEFVAAGGVIGVSAR